METANNVTQQISKRRRICSGNTSNNIDEFSETKLFHLNADCLGKIFQHLDLKDIVNLAEANLSDYDDSVAETNSRSISRNYSYEEAIRDHFMRIEGDIYNVTNDPANSVFLARVYRHFHPILLQISIRYYPKYYRHNAMMERIILKHSLEFVTSIIFDNADQCAFEDISKPFANVKQLTFEGGHLSQKLGDFNQWFPRLESLTMNETMFSNPQSFEKPFPNLKLLSVKNKHLCRCRHKNNWYENVDDDMYILKNENLKNFMALNPQLQTLNILQGKFERSQFRSTPDGPYIQIDGNMLKFISINIPRLRQLHVHQTFQFIEEIEIINFRHLRTLSVEASEIGSLTANHHIIADQLVSLSLHGKSYYVDYESICEFVGRFKNINCLLIETPLEEIRNQSFVKMIKGLRNLISLNITLSENNFPNDAIFCMSQFDHLRVLQIRCTKILLQHCETVLNAINRCSFMKDNNWRGVIGCQWANFIFEKSEELNR